MFFRYSFDQRVDFVGAGGLGQVFKARDLLLGTTVALKQINWARLGVEAPEGEWLREKLINNLFVEAKAHARLSQLTNHVVEVSNVGFENSCHFLAMEWMEGGSLRGKGGKLPFTEVQSIIRQAADGLRVAHAHGVLHCDISPDNILSTGRHSYKLSDFGLLNLVNTHLVSNGGPSLLRGGKEYWLPTVVLTGEEQPSTWSDLYGLALVFHNLLTGELLTHNKGMPFVVEPLKRGAVDLPAIVAVFLRDVFTRRISSAELFSQRLSSIALP